METLDGLLASLSSENSTINKVSILQEIWNILSTEKTCSQLCEKIANSNLVFILSKVILYTSTWAKNISLWLDLTSQLFEVMQLKVDSNQIIALVESIKTLFKLDPQPHFIRLLVHISDPLENRIILLNDKTLFIIFSEFFTCVFSISFFIALLLQQADIIKESSLGRDYNLALESITLMVSLTDATPEWQFVILQDTLFIVSLLTTRCADTDDFWIFMENLSQHPDAKTLLPSSVLEKASKTENAYCLSICANLCNETHAGTLKMTAGYIAQQAQDLKRILKKKLNTNFQIYTNLLDVILPLVNLSVADSNKDIVGENVAVLLIEVLEIDENSPLHPKIARNLERVKREASKALWNLAFTEANQKRISKVKGIERLKTIHKNSSDTLLQKNIDGILFMFSKPIKRTSGHIMISYSWAHQTTILRLANSLKQLGYLIWLDVEQMAGSTLETMAGAIERADLVLMCMSQKYKDSPNCRLEGEYSVNRRIDFIPLLLQPQYHPDGWLGIALGTKLYHDFSDEHNWDTKIEMLVKEIGERGKGREINNNNHARKRTYGDTEVVDNRKPENWQAEDILRWMTEERIERYHQLFVQHKLDGKSLLELKNFISPSNPNFFTFFTMLGISEIGEMLRIAAAIKKL